MSSVPRSLVLAVNSTPSSQAWGSLAWSNSALYVDRVLSEVDVCVRRKRKKAVDISVCK